jgi:hypothetical protein
MSRLDVRRRAPTEEANERIFVRITAGLRSASDQSDQPETAARAGVGCLWCALHDARDRERTARWLRAGSARGRDAIGVACCPLHTWRAYTLAEVDDVAGQASILDAIHLLYLRAIQVERAQIQQAASHMESGGPANWLRSVHASGLLQLRPACPLCSERLRQTPEERAAVTAWLTQRLEKEPVWLRRAALAGACRAHAPTPWQAPLTAPDPRTPPQDYLQNRLKDRAAKSWWLGPGASAQGAALLWRLLGEERGGSEGEQDARPLPDGLCPLCVARWEHESVALHALTEDEGKETFDQRALCSRHHAFIQASEARAVRLVDAAVTLVGLAAALRQEPAGALSGSLTDDVCPVCVTLRGWDLARIEGLHRASGGALLYERVTERLALRLADANYQFCLPHLRELLSAGARERVWETLGDSVERGVAALRHRAEALARDGTEPAPSASLIRLMLAAALGGLPV